jgi:radical SAM superfamily enzyme YgiQ (UPF0313 family)
MKVCLIYPPIDTGNLYEEWDLSDVDSLSPPLGLLLIAAVLRREGHDVSFVDAYSNGFSEHKTAQLALEFKPDIVGISATSPVAVGSGNVAALIKQMAPEVVTMIGGPHVTAVPRETMEKLKGFDIGVLGEGELTSIELLKAIEMGTPLDTVKGLVFRKNGELVITPERPFLPDLDWLPFPAWDLLPSLTSPYKVSISSMTSGNSTAIITSRGCPGKCTFCDTRVFGQKSRAHSAGYVLDMMEYLMTHHDITDFAIYDDNFTTFRSRLKEICSAIIERGYKITWSCNARVNMVNAETLKLMRQAGCWQVEYGIETGSPTILKKMNKMVNHDQIRQAVDWAKAAGMLVKGNFIFGYIGETRDTLNETLQFLKTIKIDYFQQTFLTPYPGSAVHALVKEYGTANLDWTKLNNNNINFIPNGLSESELIDFSKKAFRSFYLQPRVIFTHAKRITNPHIARRYISALICFIKAITRTSKRS